MRTLLYNTGFHANYLEWIKVLKEVEAVIVLLLLLLFTCPCQTEVHIMHGLYTPSAAFFRNTSTLHKIAPSRAKTRMGTIPDSRTLNPYVSYEERVVVKVKLPVHRSESENTVPDTACLFE